MAPTSPQDLTKLAKDAVYVTVGLGVISFQKMQLQRRDLEERVRGQVDGLSKRVEERVKTAEERFEAIESRVEAALDQFEERLPEQARAASKQARTAAKDARTQVRGLVARGAA
jgi:ElaB/YqjD/DUF883 family membrane-anchored ribosome-binding protein